MVAHANVEVIKKILNEPDSFEMTNIESLLHISRLAYEDGSYTMRHLTLANKLAEQGESTFTIILLIMATIYESFVSRKIIMHLKFQIIDQQQELRERKLITKRI